MRIISGTLKGRRLTAPTGLATRPTADRVRESVFNILGGNIRADLVLDLFAGTGALGIEALSRGANAAIFLDRSKAALTTIRRNIRELNLEDRCRVVALDIRKGLRFLSAEKARVDLVFMDPPYADTVVLHTLSALVHSEALAPAARIVIEHSHREIITPLPPELALIDQRRYGKTLVSFLDNVL